jgi:hypothetical protein
MAIDPTPAAASIFVESLNELTNSQQARLTAFRTRIPALVLLVLYGIAIFAAGFIGYDSAMRSRRSSMPIYAVTILFVVVIVLVQDLDRPEVGFIRVDQQPLIDVADRLATYLR